VDQFARDLDVCVLMSKGEEEPRRESQDFTLKIMKSHWDDAFEARMRQAVDCLFETCCGAYSSNCGLITDPLHPGHVYSRICDDEESICNNN
jgi:hypothetical protein